ncbi:hypothetical protein ACH4J0_42965, partial [Kitasatospora sp. NPDC017646]
MLLCVREHGSAGEDPVDFESFGRVDYPLRRGSHLHEDVTLARVVQTSGGCPSQWDAWTSTGQY